jgi:SAM-dependent methyltransferase
MLPAVDLRNLSRRVVTRVTPLGLRARVRDVPLLQRLAGRASVDVAAESEEARERSRRRWREARPEADLTWGEEITGDAFIAKVAEHAPFAEATRVFEIGPGYGRLPAALLASGLPFAGYVGLDLSEENVRHLGERFDDPRLTFRQGDSTAVEIEPFDAGLSSLTFKHIYPSFGPALANCRDAMGDDARFVFDLIEGTQTYFESDDRTFVRAYRRHEVEEIVRDAGLRIVAFDEVEHARNRHRLLVVVGR